MPTDCVASPTHEWSELPFSLSMNHPMQCMLRPDTFIWLGWLKELGEPPKASDLSPTHGGPATLDAGRVICARLKNAEGSGVFEHGPRSRLSSLADIPLAIEQNRLNQLAQPPICDPSRATYFLPSTAAPCASKLQLVVVCPLTDVC